MDESWRKTLPRRRSSEESTARRRRRHAAEDPDDFRDVFGGPPRSVLLRRFSGEQSAAGVRKQGSSVSLYDEVFGGRSIPRFSIPQPPPRKEEGFYDDVFGCGRLRSRSRSSVLSSDENSPTPALLRHRRPLMDVADDDMFASFTSKLRPITIPSHFNNTSPTTSMISGSGGEASSHMGLGCPPRSYLVNNKSSGSSSSAGSALQPLRRKNIIGFPLCCKGNLSRDPGDSPSSVISSEFLLDPPPPLAESSSSNYWEQNYVVDNAEDRERERKFDVMRISGGGIIGVSAAAGDGRTQSEGTDASVDEAIAWAKQKYLCEIHTSNE